MTRCWTQIELELEQTVQKVECRQNRLRNGVNLRSKFSSLVVRWTTQQIVGWDRGGQNWFPNNQKYLTAVFPGYGVLGPGYWVASAQNYPHKYCRVSPDKGLPINCIKSLGNSLLLEGRLAT